MLQVKNIKLPELAEKRETTLHLIQDTTARRATIDVSQEIFVPTLRLEYRDEDPILVENTDPITLPFKAYITTKDGKTTTEGIDFTEKMSNPICEGCINSRNHTHFSGNDDIPEVIIKYSNYHSNFKKILYFDFVVYKYNPNDPDKSIELYHQSFRFNLYTEPQQ